MERTYIAIDLKSFYASAECADRNLDPLLTNLVVADCSRTEKTICLAVSPSLKALGIPGRPRLFEVIQKVAEINRQRLRYAPGHRFTGKSSHAPDLQANPSLELSYVTAVPRMARYIEVSSKIYGIYLKYVSPDDLHVYSIDEVFIDATTYLKRNKLTAREFAMKMIRDVLRNTGITATAGIGTNLYLAKIAMDIVAKHIPADRDGVRIAELDEAGYRRQLWNHKPLTDFWRIGNGYADRLAFMGLHTMGDVARASLTNEDALYKMFGINAELLIDHAWGWEPCTIKEIKAYKPESNSASSGQVLQEAYDFTKARLVAVEMADAFSLDLVEKDLVTDQVALVIGYDASNLATAEQCANYTGAVRVNHYGKTIPKEAHGALKLPLATSSSSLIRSAIGKIFDSCVDKGLFVRRITVIANHVAKAAATMAEPVGEQLDLFTDYEALARERAAEQEKLQKEHCLQLALLDVKRKLGKNAILKGMNLMDGSTAKARNEQIGGHRK